MRRWIVLLTVLATACGGSGSGGPGSPTPQPFNQTVTGTVSVFGTTFHPISTARAGTMRLTLSWSSGVDLDLYLTNPTCEIANLASCQLLAAADGFVNPETISRTVSTNESFRVFVDNNSTTQSASYTLTIRIE
jgi:hypothetical protein